MACTNDFWDHFFIFYFMGGQSLVRTLAELCAMSDLFNGDFGKGEIRRERNVSRYKEKDMGKD